MDLPLWCIRNQTNAPRIPNPIPETLNLNPHAKKTLATQPYPPKPD